METQIVDHVVLQPHGALLLVGDQRTYWTILTKSQAEMLAASLLAWVEEIKVLYPLAG